MEQVLKACSILAGHRYALDPAIRTLGEKRVPREGRVVASVRRFVRDVAADWGAADGVPEVAELLVSELVTNAVAYGAAGVPHETAVRVVVGRERELLIVEVYDSCVTIPRMRRAGDADGSGRGLAIVDTLAHAWGWTPNPHGKSVWFQLAAWPPD
ncbi:ATP-binding protein [Planobispora takensis]|uniref:Histidine kinase/HSP90-like ATPase domain-containing protein n=1 Tax=Planobispora takensis TaxID=1367882 RepID=A0A8J3T1Z0_9ACTN|nr:ATP-binding protein [Planobispora takensis]GII04622.1 hypothetical protein Pta02_66300 [Planobispora takensis]